MKHTQEECLGVHCKCMGCERYHYADHVQECGHTAAQHEEGGCKTITPSPFESDTFEHQQWLAAERKKLVKLVKSELHQLLKEKREELCVAVEAERVISDTYAGSPIKWPANASYFNAGIKAALTAINKVMGEGLSE